MAFELRLCCASVNMSQLGNAVHGLVDNDGLHVFFFVSGPLMVPDIAANEIHNETLHSGIRLLQCLYRFH